MVVNLCNVVSGLFGRVFGGRTASPAQVPSPPQITWSRVRVFPRPPSHLVDRLPPRPSLLTEEEVAEAAQIPIPCGVDESMLPYPNYIPPEPLDEYDESPERSRRIYEIMMAEVRAAMELDEDYRRKCEEIFRWQAGEGDTDGAGK